MIDVQLETTTRLISLLSLTDTEYILTPLLEDTIMKKIIIVQKWFRGCIVRLKQLPLIMYKIKKYLEFPLQIFKLSNQNEDGRINSCIDEDIIIKLLIEKFGDKIKKPKMRMWYDILAFDYMYGWIPINIKTTTMTTCDNTSNLAMCVYAYTDEILDIHRNKTYENGIMSDILFSKIKNIIIITKKIIIL